VDDSEAFARLLTALRPWLGQLVVVGGWAHRLHRLHPLANPPGHLPLRTRDADLAFSADEALAGDVRTALTELASPRNCSETTRRPRRTIGWGKRTPVSTRNS